MCIDDLRTGKPIAFRKIESLLNSLGYERQTHGNGTHLVYRKENRPYHVLVCFKTTEIPKWQVKRILKALEANGDV